MAQGQGQAQNPGAPADIVGLPANADVFEFAGFLGVDTKPKRPAIADDHSAWMRNLMPLGNNNVRALPDVGSAFYGAPGGTTIVMFDFFILQPNGVFSGASMAVFLSDGSARWVSIPGGVDVALAPAATFDVTKPIAVRQWGTQYLLIATEQGDNGYWIWDGTLLYKAGTVGPQVTITDGGVGYTGAPTVTIKGGTGSGATFTAHVLNGGVDRILITNPGSGWLATDASQAVLLFDNGAGLKSAWGTATVVDGAITGLEILAGGFGFTAIPVLTVNDATGAGCTIGVTGISGGVITSVVIFAAGANYSNPNVTFAGGGGGVGLNIQPLVESGVITNYTVGDLGAGYTAQPTVRFIAATGSGATARASLSAGTIVGIDFGRGANPAGGGVGFTGKGYPTAAGAVIVAFEGGFGPASATIQLMPFGIQGHAIEVYQSRAWIASSLNVVKVFFTAPNAVANFGPPDGGGAFPATDSVLRYSWINLLQSNGFLYLLGDSSVNYISGVTTTGSPAITTFSNLNVDPDTGTPWRDSAITFGRAIIMANSIGVHAVYGGAVQDISPQLDGVYSTGAANFGNLLYSQPSSAKAQIYGVKVYILLLPIIDPVSGNAVNALMMWDGKRWFSAQSTIAFKYIRTLEIGSDISAWGTNGTSIYRMFTTPSVTTSKVLRSKQWIKPTIIDQKKSWMLYALWQGEANTTLTFTIDTENGSANVTRGAFTSAGTAIGWARSACPDSAGYVMGWTLTSTSTDFTLMNIDLVGQDYRRRT